MSKTQTQRTASHSHGKKQKKPLIPEQYQDLAFCGLLVLAILIFLGGVIFGSGNFSNASDNIASYSFGPYLKAANKSGSFPLWIPYIFGGMPGYAALITTGDRWWDFLSMLFLGVTRIFGSLFSSDAARVSVFYMVYGIGMYLLMRIKKHERFVSFFTAFAAVFSTWVITWIMIGHNTKPIAFMTLPYIFICLEKLRERFTWLYTGLLILAVHLLVESTHVQMIFYAVCAFGLYILLELISRLIKKEDPASVLRPIVLLLLAGGLAFAMGADRYLSVKEYSAYSTRATAPIEQKKTQQQDASGGFDYDYSTNWSFSPEEMMTFLVPNYYGYGKLAYKGPETGGEKAYIGTYWGQMPFTDAANYMGIGVLALGMIGAIRYRKIVFVQFLIVLSLFALLLSFGKNFSILYDFFFYHVPSFNKFRAPSMALALMQFAMPILAGYGITGLVEMHRTSEEKDRKKLLYGVIGAVVFLVVGFLYSAVGKEGYLNAVLASPIGKQYPESMSIQNFVYNAMISDWYVTALIAICFMGAAYLFVQKKISKNVFFTLLAMLLIVDLWRVDWRGMETTDKQPAQTVFRTTDVIQFLQQDHSLHRIATFSGSPNAPAYFFQQNIHGYSSAKLRVYQDLLDVAGKGSGSVIANPFLWNLLNVKYILSDRSLGEGSVPVFQSQEERMLVYENPSVLPRAFFVNRAEQAQPIAILHHLRDGDFNPHDVAYIEQPLGQTLEPAGADAKATVTNFENEYIRMDVHATGNNLLFISEAYYPVSWHATIDGKEVPIYKTNYAFRSVIVPAGNHVLEMRFTSPNFNLGKNISLAANLVALGVLVVGIVVARKQKSASSEAETKEEREEVAE